MRRYLFFLILALVQACAARAPRPRVVLISVDGLWARDLQRAESAGVRLPTLDSLRRSGELAAGVIGSFPSVTYPSHTTMITGVPPARHGVYANGIFSDPSERRAFNPSYWERSEIRVPTIFDAAARAGLSVAAVFWPVTAHDPSIRYNIPDAWDPRPGAPSQLAALRYLGTPWLLDSIGAPAAGAPNDSMRAAWTAAIIRRWNPDFIALHLIDLDHFKHEYGIWSDSARTALRARDRDISVVLAAVAATEAGRQTTVIVTSDHGFLDYSQRLRPGVLLSRAGLVTVDTAATPPVRTWQAGVQVNGGSVMILPRDSTDPTLAARTRAAIPDTLVGPGKPIRAVLPRDTIALLGGDPRALWALDLNDGFYATSGYAGALLSAARGGGHGYDQRRQELHAFFLMTGAGVASGTMRPLMRQTQIAGIVARILSLPGF